MKKIAFSVVLALAVLEPVARLWVQFDPLSTVSSSMAGDPDPELLYRPRPGAHVDRTDEMAERYTSLGTRGPEPDLSRRRVLVIGDSVSHGFRIREEDTYSRQLERKLDGTTVINAGVCGYQPWNERARLRQLAPVVRPDVVVIQWCQNDKHKGLESLAAPELSLRAAPLIESVHLSPIGLVSAARYVSVLRAIGRIRADVEANPPPLRWRGEWQDAYHGLVADAVSDGRRAVALIVPSQRTVESDATESDPEPARIAREGGAFVVDPLAAIRAAGGDLWVDPIHPNPRGQAVLAEALAAALAT